MAGSATEAAARATAGWATEAAARGRRTGRCTKHKQLLVGIVFVAHA